MKATVEVMSIGPKQAAEYLRNMFPGQRKLRETKVARLKMDMQKGRFKLSPDAILLIRQKIQGGAGFIYLLANGQHRLTAVVESGVTCQFLVMTSDDEELYKVIDDVMKRQVSDALQDCKNATVVAAATNWVIKYERNMLSPRGYKTRVATRIDQIDYVDSHKDVLMEAVAFVSPLSTKYHFMTKSLATAFLVLAWKHTDKSQANAFMSEVFHGNSNGPAQLMHQKLHDNLAAKAKLSQSYILAILIKAYNAYVTGQKKLVLKMADGENFPRLEKTKLAAALAA